MGSLMTTMKKRIENQSSASIALCFMILLQGCMAAPVAYPVLVGAQYAMYGWHGFKVVQMSTGGSAEVRFKDSELSFDDQRALSSLECLAVYPGGEKNVKLAEALAKSSYWRIITPYSVETTLPDTFRFGAFERMTEQEQVQYACGVGEALKADGVLVYLEKGYGSDIRGFFSPKRSESITKFEVKVFSTTYQKALWVKEGKIVWKWGAREPPPQDEIDQITASAVAEKLLSDSGKE